MDFLYYIPKTKLRTDQGPLAGAGIIIHPEPELRSIYARQMRTCLGQVEAGESLADIELLLRVVQPRIIVMEQSLVLPIEGQRKLRQLREAYPEIALATVGAGDGDVLSAARSGIRAHISSTATRVGALSQMVRDLV
jgi:hypothetical protein